MEHLKRYTFKNFNLLASLLFLITGCLFLLMLRLKLSHSFYLLFLVWNLFLAIIPLGIVMYVEETQLTGLKKWIALGIWLLFLPNAPYIITDFIHLKNSQGVFQIFDVVVIGSFAIAGLYCYLISFYRMLKNTQDVISKKMRTYIQIAIPFLCGVGIYLGRVERWNSWDLITQPTLLIKNILKIGEDLFTNTTLWIFVLGTTLFLFCLQKIVEKRFLKNLEF